MIAEERRGERKVEEGWWDKECEMKKRRVRRSLRNWREGRWGGQIYRKEKREYKELCERKKQEENKIWDRGGGSKDVGEGEK